MNNKGFAATGILYTILMLFILLMTGILAMLYSRNFLLTTIKNNIKENLENADIVYFEGDSYYKDAITIYYNPVTGRLCNDYVEANSATGIKSGCLKWYAYSETDNEVNMILDHNTTAKVAWNSSGSNVSGPKEVLESLKNDTDSWVGTAVRTDNYTYTSSNSNYTIDYAGGRYRARLITADEVAAITGNTGFDASQSGMNWFCLDTNVYDSVNWCSKAEGTSNFKWLFNNTSGCKLYGCSIEFSDNYGYWTSTLYNDNINKVWTIERNSYLYDNDITNSNEYGVRPVISVDKSVIYPEQYSNGSIITFNPVTGKLCNDYVASNSLSQNKTGCMKWHVFNDHGTDDINLILDHNTTSSVYWNYSGTNVSGPADVLTKLKDDTKDWLGVDARTDTYSYTSSNSSYVIDYATNGYRARLITADEVAGITSKQFDETTTPSNSWFYFDSGTQTALPSGSKSIYAWLFNYTNSCSGYGCLIEDSTTQGYWTSSASIDTTYSWRVYKQGRLNRSEAKSNSGVRPVITLSRSKIQNILYK